MRFAKKTVQNLQPYRVVPQEAWNDPKGCLKLDWNESTISLSPHVKASLINAIDEINFNWYPNVHNEKLLRKLSDYTQLPVENILYFASSDSAHEYIARTFLEASDEVLIVGPTYDNFRVTCQSESYSISFFFNEDVKADVSKIDKAIYEKEPKLVYICNPNNPTGTIYTKEEIKMLLENHPDTLFLVDEAYIEFSPYESTKDLVLDYNNIVVCRTFSKAFGLASFRVGYILSSAYNLEYIGRIRNPKSVTALSQVATIAALEDTDHMWQFVKTVKASKQFFIEEMNKLGIKTANGGGGNFCLIQVPNPKEYIAYLRKNKIYVRDYTHVKELNGINVRVTMGTLEQMALVVRITKEYMSHVG